MVYRYKTSLKNGHSYSRFIIISICYRNAIFNNSLHGSSQNQSKFFFFNKINHVLLMYFSFKKVGRFMCQPCVKFISHTITYIVFILLIIISSLQFAQDEKQARKFSNLYPALMPNFTDYVNNVYLKYRFNENDFYLRSSFPSNIDFVISIWIFGKLF
jgi:hypothetical protein